MKGNKYFSSLTTEGLIKQTQGLFDFCWNEGFGQFPPTMLLSLLLKELIDRGVVLHFDKESYEKAEKEKAEKEKVEKEKTGRWDTPS